LKLPVPASLIGYRELTLGTRVLSNQKPSFWPRDHILSRTRQDGAKDQCDRFIDHCITNITCYIVINEAITPGTLVCPGLELRHRGQQEINKSASYSFHYFTLSVETPESGQHWPELCNVKR
jgi:hypothetical protein